MFISDKNEKHILWRVQYINAACINNMAKVKIEIQDFVFISSKLQSN